MLVELARPGRPRSSGQQSPPRLYATRSARDHDGLATEIDATFEIVPTPPDVFDRALEPQRDLAHHHGMWHRTPFPDLPIACTALHRGRGIVHVDHDFERIAEIRPLVVRRLG